MEFAALPDYFIIKVEKELQKETRQKEGHFYTHSDHVFMQRETQYGEIVSIGDEAQNLFPDAKIGQTLITHHFVTGRDMEYNSTNRNHIYSDETHNYYRVTIKSGNGERNLTYGVFNGTEIIPHKQYIFLEIPENKIEQEQSSEGLISLLNLTESRDGLGLKMKEIKNEINELTKANVSQELTQEIERKQNEMNKISKQVNKKMYLLYKVAYVSPFIKSKFQKEFSHVAVLNIATNTKLFFNGNTYIVADTKYLACCK